MVNYDRPTLNLYADLAVLAVELTNGRMTREAYIDAAVALGLTLGQAEIRAAAFSEMASCT